MIYMKGVDDFLLFRLFQNANDFYFFIGTGRSKHLVRLILGCIRVS